jgi:hypothetical protein
MDKSVEDRGRDARRELTGLRAKNDGKLRRIDLGFIGADLRNRVLMTTLVAAATAMHPLRVRMHFFLTMEEAQLAMDALSSSSASR